MPRALDSNTMFEVGSITKVFTATVLADMVLQGEVSLDDSLGHYISGVALPTRDGESIRLVDLATYTAGLPRIPRNLWPNMFKSPKNPYAGYSRADLYEALSTVKIRRTFRTNIRYSNFGFALLGHALEIAAGIPYERLLDERLFAPLGMDSTTIRIAETERARIAQGHKKKKTVPPWDLGAFEGAGAVRSTLDDMLRFLRANMYREGRIGEAARFAHAPRHVKKSGRQEVGLGWMRTRGRSGRWTVWHNGGTADSRASWGSYREEMPVSRCCRTPE